MSFRSFAQGSSTLHLRYLILAVSTMYIFTSLLYIAHFKSPHFKPSPAAFNTSHYNNCLEYRFTNPSAYPVPGKQTVLVLTLVRDRESWSDGRSFPDFLSIVQGFDHPMSNINLGVLVSDKNEFNAITDYIKHLPDGNKNFFGHIHVILREKDAGIPREHRRADDAQRDRRRLIARLRNYLLYTTMRDEDSVLWIDSDMIRVPNDLLNRMIDSGKDIITTATRSGPSGGFIDLNAWVGERIKPNAEEQAIIEQGGIFVPRPKSVKFTHELQGEFTELDSVGGTVLFVRGEVHREGVAFTTNYVIGSGWEYEGYDGIESEGLCYVAGFLGYKCWGMPHAIAEHSES
ncbi:MAG: Anp1-domain-containing protein [Linnemannia elongata]|nr:MAG: Anp1-domain-containing protein [Linnemannia elongata]